MFALIAVPLPASLLLAVLPAIYSGEWGPSWTVFVTFFVIIGILTIVFALPFWIWARKRAWLGLRQFLLAGATVGITLDALLHFSVSRPEIGLETFVLMLPLFIAAGVLHALLFWALAVRGKAI